LHQGDQCKIYDAHCWHRYAKSAPTAWWHRFLLMNYVCFISVLMFAAGFVMCLYSNRIPPYIATWLACINLATFLLHGWDKMQAVLQGRRVRERSLHALSILGGWPAAFLGQMVFRHKTAKPIFALVHWASVAASVVAAYLLW
jgi:uncharacterized membrane protein YsdA (DUF1294 family)